MLFGLNLLQYVAPDHFLETREPLRRRWPGSSPSGARGSITPCVLASTAAAFPFLLWKARSAQRDDHRRARFFLQLLFLTFGPMLLEILLELLPIGYRAFTLAHPPLKLAITIAVLTPALTLPFTVPYAVLVHQVLDVRLMARRALQYALARYAVLGLVMVPLAPSASMSV